MTLINNRLLKVLKVFLFRLQYYATIGQFSVKYPIILITVLNLGIKLNIKLYSILI